MKCSICKGEIEKKLSPITGRVIWDKGNNAQPINDGRCCDNCNNAAVIKKRIGVMKNDNNKK